MEKICVICGRKFFTKKKARMTCSKKCSMERKRRWNREWYRLHGAKKDRKWEEGYRVCRLCGNSFLSGGKALLICPACRKRIAEYRKSAVKRCWNCGKAFIPFKVTVDEWGIHPAGRYFCCIRCTDEWIEKKERERKWKESHGSWPFSAR